MIDFSGIAKELAVTLKYYYAKKQLNAVEITLKCLIFKVPWGRLNTSLKVTFESSHPE